MNVAGGDGRGGAALRGAMRQVVQLRSVSCILTDAGIATGYQQNYNMMLGKTCFHLWQLKQVAVWSKSMALVQNLGDPGERTVVTMQPKQRECPYLLKRR